MKLSDLAIKELTVRARNRIALELDCSVPTVDRWVKDNEPNGDLTKTKVIQIIREETGLQDSEILEEGVISNESQNS